MQDDYPYPSGRLRVIDTSTFYVKAGESFPHHYMPEKLAGYVMQVGFELRYKKAEGSYWRRKKRMVKCYIYK